VKSVVTLVFCSSRRCDNGAAFSLFSLVGQRRYGGTVFVQSSRLLV